MSSVPTVLVTASTELIRGEPRVRVNEAYTNALAAFGLVPLVLPPMDDTLAVQALGSAAGLLLTGGEDVSPHFFGEAPHPAAGDPHPVRDSYELALVRAAAHLRVPTLAICRGAQVVNVALGGSLIQDIPSQSGASIEHAREDVRRERVHAVRLADESRLARITGETTIRTNSLHHQAVARVADALRATAQSEDGVIEAVEPTDSDWWMIGVQWHPEELQATEEDSDRRLFYAFAERVRARAAD
jgi:putative glutamine amidotransferase